MKLLVIPKNKECFLQEVDGYILPLKDFSVSYEDSFDLREISEIVQTGKEVFVVINKNIFNHEIKLLEEILYALEKVGPTGVFFYDLSVLSIVKRLSLKISLVWNQTHMVTNYNTINYYLSKGVKGALLANEITLDEMVEIRKKTDAKLFVNIIYRPIMSFTRRSLIHNFYKSSGIDSNANKLVIHEKISGDDFLLKEEKDGTTFFHGRIVNGLSALPVWIENNFDYGIIDLANLEDGVGELCLKTVRSIIDGEKFVDTANISSKIGDYTGFLYKKTIYRVK